MTWGQFLQLVAALAIVVVVAGLALVLNKAIGILTEIQLMLRDVRKETVPLLEEVRTTVTTVNVEIDRVDGIMASAETAAASVSNVAKLVSAATANPIIKALAFLTGASVSVKAVSKNRGRKRERKQRKDDDD